MIKNRLGLTKRELEILELLAIGWSNNVIANKLSISINTVKYHVKKIFTKLQAKNRIEALNKMYEAEHSSI